MFLTTMSESKNCVQCYKELKPGKKFYICSDCHEEKFCSKKCLNQHRTSAHPEEYTCSKCNKSLISKITNKIHYLVCSDCDDGVKYCKKGDCLEVHRRKQHFDTYFCQSCHKYLISRFRSTFKYLTCDICGESAGRFCNSTSCLERHYRKVHPGQRVCAICDDFIEEKSIFCSDCGEGVGKFCSQSCFNTHIQREHPDSIVK